MEDGRHVALTGFSRTRRTNVQREVLRACGGAELTDSCEDLRTSAVRTSLSTLVYGTPLAAVVTVPLSSLAGQWYAVITGTSSEFYVAHLIKSNTPGFKGCLQRRWGG